AVEFPPSERERLARALGVAVKEPISRNLPMATAAPPNPAAWRKAEAGHAVLPDDVATANEGATGPKAIEGIWSGRQDELLKLAPIQKATNELEISSLGTGQPVIVHFDVCAALACCHPSATQFFDNHKLELRLSTAGYLN